MILIIQSCRTCDEAFQALWVSIHIANKSTVICGVIYRQHNSPEKFLSYFEQTVEKLNASGKRIFIMTDANIIWPAIRKKIPNIVMLPNCRNGPEGRNHILCAMVPKFSNVS